MKLFILTIGLYFLISCNDNEYKDSNDLLYSVKKLEPILEKKCKRKAIVSAFVFNGRIIDSGVVFLTKKFEFNNNTICSKTMIKEEFIHFFQEEYGYINVNFYIIYDDYKTKL